MPSDWKIDVGVPDVGDIVEYGGDTYVVQSWLRERRRPKINPDEGVAGFLDDIFYQAQQEIKGKKLEWCYQDEAQFLSLRGVGGTVAPVNEVKVVGKVNWNPEKIEEARRMAILMADNGDVLY
jgi:hypothetical protein